ncbi:ASCH domain protein [compost metagenome]
MKVITIIQPWATLIALGEKRFETRSWATKHRGDLLIHAGKKVDKKVCQQEPYRSVLGKHGYTADNLPTGSIIAKVNLHNCYAISRRHGVDGPVSLETSVKTLEWADPMEQEYYFGDYRDGRYAWELLDVQRMLEPISAKGMQGLWNWEIWT